MISSSNAHWAGQGQGPTRSHSSYGGPGHQAVTTPSTHRHDSYSAAAQVVMTPTYPHWHSHGAAASSGSSYYAQSEGQYDGYPGPQAVTNPSTHPHSAAASSPYAQTRSHVLVSAGRKRRADSPGPFTDSHQLKRPRNEQTQAIDESQLEGASSLHPPNKVAASARYLFR